MNASSSPTRLWLIDWFGHIIDHDPIRDELIRRPFTSNEYPDLFLLAPLPLHLPIPAVLRKRSSIVRSLPELEVVDGGAHLIGLRDTKRGTYFSVNPRNELTHFNAEALMGWEKFSPVTFEMLNGLSTLIDPQRATVLDNHGKPCGPLVFKPAGDNAALLQKFEFSLGRNADTLATIGDIAPGASRGVTLKGAHGSGHFTIQRNEEKAGHAKTP